MTGERDTPRIDVRTPNLARMNDYFLGGKDHFAADREAADALLEIAPEVADLARDLHAFQVRLVRRLLGQGVRQFVHLDPGLPTRDSTHELAYHADPSAKVVYVAADPVVLAHARALLADAARFHVVEGDTLTAGALLAGPEIGGLLDPAEPVAVLLLGVLQFIPDEDGPYEAVARIRDALSPGGRLGLAHVVFDDRPDAAGPIQDLYRGILSRSESAEAARTTADVRRFVGDLALDEPGLVPLAAWHPGIEPPERRTETVRMVGCSARKRF